MNSFADTLLSLLFGWLRALVEGIWGFISSGEMRNTISWLGDHWLWLVIVVCIVCVVLDYFIWLIRWKPYIIWRNKLRRLFGRKAPSAPHPVEADYFEFQMGYDQGVDLDMQDMPYAPQPQEENDFSIWQQPAFQPPQEEFLPPPVPYAEAPMLPPVQGVRNRRSDRYDKKKFRLSGILPSADDEAETMLDGLPPAINKNEAFHAPVYPGQYNNQQG